MNCSLENLKERVSAEPDDVQILIEEGLLSKVQPPPIEWNFGVWGWIGFMRQHVEVTENTELRPDSFLKHQFRLRRKGQ